MRAGDRNRAKGRDEGRIAGDESGAQAGRPERFDSELKIATLAKLPSAANAVSSALGRGVGIDLRVALVGEQHEVEAAGERDGGGEVAPVGDGALRVRRRAEIERNGPLQQRLVDAVERREELGGCVAFEEDRFRTGGCAAA